MDTVYREHVNRNTVNARSALLNELIIRIRCVNKESHAKYGGGEVLELRTAGVNYVTHK